MLITDAAPVIITSLDKVLNELRYGSIAGATKRGGLGIVYCDTYQNAQQSVAGQLELISLTASNEYVPGGIPVVNQFREFAINWFCIVGAPDTRRGIDTLISMHELMREYQNHHGVYPLGKYGSFRSELCYDWDRHEESKWDQERQELEPGEEPGIAPLMLAIGVRMKCSPSEYKNGFYTSGCPDNAKPASKQDAANAVHRIISGELNMSDDDDEQLTTMSWECVEFWQGIIAEAIKLSESKMLNEFATPESDYLGYTHQQPNRVNAGGRDERLGVSARNKYAAGADSEQIAGTMASLDQPPEISIFEQRTGQILNKKILELEAALRNHDITVDQLMEMSEFGSEEGQQTVRQFAQIVEKLISARDDQQTETLVRQMLQKLSYGSIADSSGTIGGLLLMWLVYTVVVVPNQLLPGPLMATVKTSKRLFRTLRGLLGGSGWRHLKRVIFDNIFLPGVAGNTKLSQLLARGAPSEDEIAGARNQYESRGQYDTSINEDFTPIHTSPRRHGNYEVERSGWEEGDNYDHHDRPDWDPSLYHLAQLEDEDLEEPFHDSQYDVYDEPPPPPRSSNAGNGTSTVAREPPKSRRGQRVVYATIFAERSTSLAR